MNTVRDRQDISLLQLVSNHQQPHGNRSNICADVLTWFEQNDASRENGAKSAIRETNESGETALHILLNTYKSLPAHNERDSFLTMRFTAEDRGRSIISIVVLKFLEIDSDVAKIQDNSGCLPLHNACRDRSCDFDVIQTLIGAYPAGLGVSCNTGNCQLHTPFCWDYSNSVGGHFTEFLQYVVASDVSATGTKRNTIETRGARKRLISQCKNWVPLDILKKGMLNKKTLESKAMIRWLNEMPCKRSVVCSMVFELYLHMAWITTFISLTTCDDGEQCHQIQDWRPIALLIFTALFSMQEVYEMYRFFMTNSAMAYWLDFWNWVDLATCSLVATSAIRFIRKDPDVNILITTGFFQFVLFVSYLKKTFFPFSKFVSGVIKIFWSLMPFLVISAITLFAFSFMYYVREKDSTTYPYDPVPHNLTNPYVSLWESFKTVFPPFASGPLGESESTLDVLFGITIILILLNVVIAVVSDAWADATEEADNAFWSYRLDLILEKTRGVNEDELIPSIFWNKFGGLDDFYIDKETVGTTTGELKQKLALARREKGSLFCLLVIAKSFAFIILGFPTLGILWPKFFRQILFTPPKPKEDETKMKIDKLVVDIDECKEEVGILSDNVRELIRRVQLGEENFR